MAILLSCSRLQPISILINAVHRSGEITIKWWHIYQINCYWSYDMISVWTRPNITPYTADRFDEGREMRLIQCRWVDRAKELMCASLFMLVKKELSFYFPPSVAVQNFRFFTSHVWYEYLIEIVYNGIDGINFIPFAYMPISAIKLKNNKSNEFIWYGDCGLHWKFRLHSYTVKETP